MITMPILISSLKNEDVRAAIHKWVKLLATSSYEEAVGKLTALEQKVFTGEMLKEAIGRYSRRYREATSMEDKKRYLPTITDPDELDAQEESIEIYPVAPDGTVIVEYDLPLDGSWSDLTAIFHLVPKQGGYALSLYDVHVL